MQTEAAGNDLAGLKADFGDRLCIWGALDAQHALIEGGTKVSVEHTRRALAAAGPTGFVAGPTHTFTEDTPIDNIQAVYKILLEDGSHEA
jgi:uroporphyrinogen-III decarboxylase